MTIRTRIALRVFASALLIIAFAKFTSFQTEKGVPPADGGYQIHHLFEVNHWAVVLGLAGGVIFVISFLGRRTPATPDEI
jgi:hypothetical protein